MTGQVKPLTPFADRDLRWCLAANRIAERVTVAWFFRIISRLGDGGFWYVLILTLPLVLGPAAIPASVHLVLTGLAALGVYWLIKGLIRRPRPYLQHRQIRLRVPPLDDFSFPSGHTLQAVSFTLVAMGWFPWLAWLLVPFTVCVAASRVVLGLHYPSDVLAAVGVGILLGSASLLVVFG